ncbi:MAG: hypothetical protein F9K43_08665 [Bauldia sp.]|nr:MAG: hypothetical protein F9K43_08665 [Bauldia sp.]
MLDLVKTETSSAERYDLYGVIHRGLRKAEMELLSRLGAVDPSDGAAVAAVISDFHRLLVLARHHVVDENEYVHTALEARKPGASAGLAEDHAGHEASFVEMERMVARLEAAPASRRKPIVRALYHRTSDFVAHDFAHMLEEETVIQPLLQDLFTDEELRAIEGRIVASIPLPVMLDFTKIMIQAIDPQARLEMLSGMMAEMPAEAFHAVLGYSVKPVLTGAEWDWLDAGLRQSR